MPAGCGYRRQPAGRVYNCDDDMGDACQAEELARDAGVQRLITPQSGSVIRLRLTGGSAPAQPAHRDSARAVSGLFEHASALRQPSAMATAGPN
jgi:hypothetical protein